MLSGSVVIDQIKELKLQFECEFQHPIPFFLKICDIKKVKQRLLSTKESK